MMYLCTESISILAYSREARAAHFLSLRGGGLVCLVVVVSVVCGSFFFFLSLHLGEANKNNEQIKRVQSLVVFTVLSSFLVRLPLSPG